MAKIVIVGGGVSGLSAGIYARLHGHEAIVCERHTVAGGNLTSWDRNGYHIDNCIHWLTGTNPNSSTYKTWEDLGVLGDIEVFQGESLFTCEHEGQTLSLSRDLYRLRDDMIALSPDDEKEILALIRAVEVFQGFCGIGGKNHDEGVKLGKTLRAIPAMVRYYSITTGELSARFTHPLLRFFFSAFWGEDFGAFSLVFVFAHYCGDNGGIPKGGSFEMAKRLTQRFQDLGGTLLLGSEVIKINHKDGKANSVTLASGEETQADYVIITGDPTRAFGNYLDAPMPKKLQKLYNDPKMRRFSSYHCAISCDSASLPFEGDYIFEVPEEYKKLLNTKQLIIREFSHESGYAPEGKNIIQSLTYAYEEDATEFIELKKQSREDYKNKKKELSAAIIKLIENHFPELCGKLSCIDVWTPATYRRYTDTEVGSWMSFALPSKKLPLRISNRIDGFSNVILATQWQQSPGGLPIAADGGKFAIETINKKEKR